MFPLSEFSSWKRSKQLFRLHMQKKASWPQAARSRAGLGKQYRGVLMCNGLPSAMPPCLLPASGKGDLSEAGQRGTPATGGTCSASREVAFVLWLPARLAQLCSLLRRLRRTGSVC